MLNVQKRSHPSWNSNKFIPIWLTQLVPWRVRDWIRATPCRAHPLILRPLKCCPRTLCRKRSISTPLSAHFLLPIPSFCRPCDVGGASTADSRLFIVHVLRRSIIHSSWWWENPNIPGLSYRSVWFIEWLFHDPTSNWTEPSEVVIVLRGLRRIGSR